MFDGDLLFGGPVVEDLQGKELVRTVFPPSRRILDRTDIERSGE